MIYKFNDLIGNKVTIQLMKNALLSESFPNFSIFAGTMGTGKSSSAKAVALALTCMEKDRIRLFEPCCKCSNCVSGIAGFQNSGNSNSIFTFNAGEFEDMTQVKAMIDAIFKRDNGLENKVFIIEEAHALNNIKGAQTALLEEIDRIPKTVFVIMCTTEESKILKTLRSRAITFTFHRLNKTESRALLNIYSHKVGVERGIALSDSLQEIILKHSDGIPRNIEKAVDFALNSMASEDDLRDFYQQISDRVFIDIFSAVDQKNLSMFLSEVTNLVFTWSPSAVVESLQDFLLKTYFVRVMKECSGKTHGDTKKTFSDEDYEIVKDLLPLKDWVACINIVSTWTVEMTESELQLKLIKLYNKLVHTVAEAGLVNTKEDIANEKFSASSAFNEIEELKNASVLQENVE